MPQKLWTKVILGLLGLLVLIQLVPVNRDNPPETNPVKAPVQVQQILERACFDCHSNRTNWPWYSYVAPVSWLVARDVHEGREHVNFSEWDPTSRGHGEYEEDDEVGEEDEQEGGELQEEFIEVIREEEMPLWFYVPLHPEAKLSTADRRTLIDWARQGFPSR